MFLRTFRMQLWQTRRNLFDKSPKFFCPLSENDGKKFTKKNVSSKCSIGNAGCRFVNRFEKFSTKAQKFSLKVRKRWEIKKNYRHWFFVQKFVRTCRMELWQPRRKLSDRRPKDLLLNVRQWLKKLEILFKKYFSSKCSHGHVECSFDKPVQNFSTKSWKAFFQCPKTIAKTKS